MNEFPWIQADKNRLILKTRKCNWRKCVFCAFEKDASDTITKDDIVNQLESYFKIYQPKFLKIFNSGSFFDKNQMQIDWKDIYKILIKNNVERIRVESRPEFIPEEDLPLFTEIMIGLETKLINRSEEINKGFNVNDVKEKMERLRNNCKVGLYLLAIPYPCSEEIAKAELEQSIQESLKMTDIVHILYAIPKKNTILNKWWREGKWTAMNIQNYYSTIKKYPVSYDSAMPWFINKPKGKK